MSRSRPDDWASGSPSRRRRLGGLRRDGGGGKTGAHEQTQTDGANGQSMSETNDQDTAKGRLSLRPAGRLELGRTVDAGSVRQSFSHGRSKVVQVEVRKKRATVGAPGASTGGTASPGTTAPTARAGATPGERPAVTAVPRALTATEQAARQRALVEQQREAAKREAERREQETISILSAAEEARRREEEARKAAEEEARQAVLDAARQAGRGGCPQGGRGHGGGSGPGPARRVPTDAPGVQAARRRHRPPRRRRRPRRCASAPAKRWRRKTRRGRSAALAAS